MAKNKTEVFAAIDGAVGTGLETTGTELNTILKDGYESHEQRYLEVFEGFLLAYNPVLIAKGFAKVGDTTPAATLNHTYMALETGTIFSVGATKGQLLVGNGTAFVAQPITQHAKQADLVQIESNINRRSAIKFREIVKIGYYYDFNIKQLSSAANFSCVILNVKQGDIIKNELFEPDKQHHSGNVVDYLLNGANVTALANEGLTKITEDGIFEILIYSQNVGDFPDNDNLDNFFILANQDFIERNKSLENIFTDGAGKYLSAKTLANTTPGAINQLGANDDAWTDFKRTDYLTNCVIEFDSVPDWAAVSVLSNIVIYRKNDDNSYTYVKAYRAKRLHSILVVPDGFYVRIVTEVENSIYVGNIADLVGIEKAVPVELSSIIQLSKVYYVNDNIIGANEGFSVAAIGVKTGDNITNERHDVDSLIGYVTQYYFLKNGETLAVEVTDLMINSNHLFTDNGILYINFYRQPGRLWVLSDFVGYWIYSEQSCVTYKTFKNTSEKSKRVLWLGTSIPASGTYPESVCKKLGHKLHKLAYGGSYITRQGNLALSATITELTAEFGAGAAQFSYENRIIPYLDGTIDVCDTIIFEHGFNDAAPIHETDLITPSTVDSEIDWTSIDRSKFIGAFNFLRNKILEVKKDVNIIIVAHLENRSNQDSFGGYWGGAVCRSQQLIAEHYNFPFIDVYNFLGWSKVAAMPNTSTFVADWNAANGTDYFNYWVDAFGNISVFQYYCPDGVHPSSDNRGIAMERLTNIYTKLLLGTI